jgi:hypothetical protein
MSVGLDLPINLSLPTILNDLPIRIRNSIKQATQRLRAWFFFSSSDCWLSILRIGLGLQLGLYAFSLHADWRYLLAGTGRGLVSRDLAEALLSLESPIIPRLGWLVAAGKQLGLSETAVLDLTWYGLTLASLFLLIGLFCRPFAIVAWFLHLCSVKGGGLVTYGVDALTTIGLFYLMLSPLPDRLSLDYRLRKEQLRSPQFLGFWRRVLQLHLCFIYFFSGLTKALGAGWWNGANLWRALIRPPFAIISAEILVRAKYIFPIAGIAVWILEIGYAFFIWHGKTRRAWLLGILLMHAGIGIAMGMYLFASVMIVLNLAAFGPGILWHQRQAADKGSSPSEDVAPSPNN